MWSKEQQPLTGSAQQSRSSNPLPQLSTEVSAHIHVLSNTLRGGADTTGESCCVGHEEGRGYGRGFHRPVATRPSGAYGPRRTYEGSKPDRKFAYRAVQRQPQLCGQLGEAIDQQNAKSLPQHRPEAHIGAGLPFLSPQRQQRQRNEQGTEQRGTQAFCWRPVQPRGDKERKLLQQHQQREEQQQREQKWLPRQGQVQRQPPCTPEEQEEGCHEQQMYKRCDYLQQQQGVEVPQQARPRQQQADHCSEEFRQMRKACEQPQRQQRCQQEQPLSQQFQAQVTGRQACSRPQLSSGVHPVAVELQKLSRLYSSSFRLLSCHPVLLAQLEQPGWAPALPKETSLMSTEASGAKGAEAGSLRIQGHKAAGQRLCSYVLPGGTLPPAKGALNCWNPSCPEELCRFELVLDPSDPEFDLAMLPDGLIMHITVGAGYPRAQAALDALPAPLHCEPPTDDKASSKAPSTDQTANQPLFCH